MTIEIGELKLATRRPSDLDDKLIASTGCSAAELVGQMQAGGSNPGLVARTLAPFLDDKAPQGHDLAVLIEAAGTRTVAADVAALLVPVEVPASTTQPGK